MSIPSISNHPMIYHCVDGSPGGGIKTYVDAMANLQDLNISPTILTSLKDADLSQFKLLHLHHGILLRNFNNECPAVITMHNHAPYCPSGTKYLTDRKHLCNRAMSPIGCLWGHVVDGCGSRQPREIKHNLERAYRFLENLHRLKIPVLTVSGYLRNQLIAHGLSQRQLITLPITTAAKPADAQPLTSEVHNNYRLLYAGRINPTKCLDWLLYALAKADARINLDVAGEGWYKAKMQALAKHLNLDSRITWHGWCSQDKLSELYHNCFALCFPSQMEPAGTVILEAYAHYRPVIGSQSGGAAEYINHQNTGFLIHPGDVQELTDAIDELTHDYHKAHMMGIQGNQLLTEQFSFEKHSHKLGRIYSTVIDSYHKEIQPDLRDEQSPV